MTSSTDDLGAITSGDGSGWGPDQLTAANRVRARRDVAGSLTELKLERSLATLGR